MAVIKTKPPQFKKYGHLIKNKKGEIMKKRIYFKVYQDKDNINGNYYIDTIENILTMIPDWIESTIEYDYLMPVLEPIEMTEEEFENLPEFLGY